MKLTVDHIADLEKLIESYSPPYSEEKIRSWGKRNHCVLCQRAGYDNESYPRCTNCVYVELIRRKRIVTQDLGEPLARCACIVKAPDVPEHRGGWYLPLGRAAELAIKADKRREWLVNTIRPILIEEVEKDSKESLKTYSIGNGKGFYDRLCHEGLTER